MKKLILLVVFYSSFSWASIADKFVNKNLPWGNIIVHTLDKGNYKIFEIKIFSQADKLWVNTFFEFYDAPEKKPQSQMSLFINTVDPVQRHTLLSLPYTYIHSEHAKKTLGNYQPRILDLFKKAADEGNITANKIEPKDQKLLAAIRKNKVNDVRKALKSKPNVNVVGVDESTPIIIAARIGNLAVAKELREYGAKLDLRTPEGDTALFNAAEGNHIEFLEFLLDKGVSIETEDNSGRTLLEFFALRNNIDMVKRLLKKKADVLHKNPQFDVSFIARVGAFAQLDSSYKEMYDLLIKALKEQLQAQKQKTLEDETSKLSAAASAGAGMGAAQVDTKEKPAKPQKTHQEKSCDSPTDDEEFKKRRAEQEELEQQARLKRAIAEKAERLARHEKNASKKAPQSEENAAATATVAAEEEYPTESTKKLAPYKDYAVVYSEKAENQKKSIDKKKMEIIADKIEEYKNGEKKDVKKLLSRQGFWRLRVGDYRIIFTLNDQKKKIIIDEIKERSNAYK